MLSLSPRPRSSQLSRWRYSFGSLVRLLQQPTHIEYRLVCCNGVDFDFGQMAYYSTLKHQSNRIRDKIRTQTVWWLHIPRKLFLQCEQVWRIQQTRTHTHTRARAILNNKLPHILCVCTVTILVSTNDFRSISRFKCYNPNSKWAMIASMYYSGSYTVEHAACCCFCCCVSASFSSFHVDTPCSHVRRSLFAFYWCHLNKFISVDKGTDQRI